MGETTKIQWTDHTFNVAWGCTKVSPGCANCYAEGDSKRYGFDVWGPNAERRTFGDKHWDEPLRWNRDAERAGVRSKVFTSSMADVLDDHATIRAQLPRLLALTDATPWLDWQILTKRAENLHLVPERPNRWLGVSVESDAYRGRVERLRATPAAVRFVSFEPLLGPVSSISLAGIDWAIFGGESRGQRPCDAGWIRHAIERCRYYSTRPFVKQLGSYVTDTTWRADGSDPPWPPRTNGSTHQPDRLILGDRKGGDPSEWPADLRVREFPAVRDA